MVQLACQAEGEGIVQKLGPEQGATQLANENKRIARVQNWPDIIFGLCVLTFLCPCLLVFFIGIFVFFLSKNGTPDHVECNSYLSVALSTLSSFRSWTISADHT